VDHSLLKGEVLAMGNSTMLELLQEGVFIYANTHGGEFMAISRQGMLDDDVAIESPIIVV